MQTADIPLDDILTYQLLSEGRTVGVFQLESPGMQQLLKKVKPTELKDVAAVLALYRPGPMGAQSHYEYARRKNSGDGGATIHPDIDPLLSGILKDTYGLIVYQEQVMEILAQVTGWGYAEAENVLTAMRKKKLELLNEAKPAFMDAAHRFSVEANTALWETLIPFSDYSFNKSHAVAYAHISYWTAYLKANHGQAYLVSLLSSTDTVDKASVFVNEARLMGLPLLPPDVNASGVSFTSTTEGIRYGISHVKGVGKPAAEALLSQRPYGSIDDFFRRAPSAVLNGRVLEALSKSGVLDSLWRSREGLVPQATDVAQLATQGRRRRAEGQSSLFRVRYRPQYTEAGAPEKDSNLRAQWERETLGTVFTQPVMVLKLTRPLSGQEWEWLRGVLWATYPSQKIKVVIGSTTVTVPLQGTYSVELKETLKLVGVEAQEG